MLHFDLEFSENCVKDSLKIYEGSVSNHTLASTRCGNNTTQFISNTSPIYLLFSSDATIARTGYKIDVECRSFFSFYLFHTYTNTSAHALMDRHARSHKYTYNYAEAYALVQNLFENYVKL